MSAGTVFESLSALEQTNEALGESTQSVIDEVADTSELDLDERLLILRDLKVREKELKDAYEELKAARKRHEYLLFRYMKDRPRPIEGQKVDGSNFVPAATQYAVVQDLDAFVEWAKQHDESLIKEAARDGELNALVRERLDNGEPLPPGIGFYDREYISVRAG